MLHRESHCSHAENARSKKSIIQLEMTDLLICFIARFHTRNYLCVCPVEISVTSRNRRAFVTIYCIKLFIVTPSFSRNIFINRLDTVYYPSVSCTHILFLLDLVESLLNLFYKRIHNNNDN